MRADIAYAVEVLSSAVERESDPGVRFRLAVRHRSEMREAIRAGNPPRESYRYQWLIATTRKLLGSLSEWALEFDDQHPLDTSTVLDLFDIVETSKHHLLRQINEMGLLVEVTPQKPAGPTEASEQSAEVSVVDDVDGHDPGNT